MPKDKPSPDETEHELAPNCRRGAPVETMRIFKPINWLLSGVIIAIVWVYRGTLGLFMGGRCRFDPSCSQYMLDAVAKYGPIRGGWRGFKRICRCHPWGPFGHDPA